MQKNRSKKNTYKFNINYSPSNDLLARQNQDLLQENIRLQECLKNYQSNYKKISDQLLLVNAELQSFKVGANIFAKQHDALKLHFYSLWYRHGELQKQHDYLKDRYIEVLRKKNKHSITPNSFRSCTSGDNSETRKLTSQSSNRSCTSSHNSETLKLHSQSSSRSFTPGYKSETLESLNQFSNQGQNIKTSNEHPSITERLVRTKQWLVLISS